MSYDHYYAEAVDEAFRIRSILPFSIYRAERLRKVMLQILIRTKQNIFLYINDEDPKKKDAISIYDENDFYHVIDSFLSHSAKDIRLNIKISACKNSGRYGKILSLLEKYPEKLVVTWGIKKRGPCFLSNDNNNSLLEREGYYVASVSDKELNKTLEYIFFSKLKA